MKFVVSVLVTSQTFRNLNEFTLVENHFDVKTTLVSLLTLFLKKLHEGMIVCMQILWEILLHYMA